MQVTAKVRIKAEQPKSDTEGLPKDPGGGRLSALGSFANSPLLFDLCPFCSTMDVPH